MKKITSIILSIMILITMLSIAPLNVSASTEATILLNEETTVAIDDNETGAWLYFTPETSGYYKLSSFADNCDPVCDLYIDMTFLSSQDDADDLNFSLVEYLTAGTTYRYDIYTYEYTEPVSFTVLLTETDAPEEVFPEPEFDYFFLDDNTVCISDYYGESTVINIPENIDGYTVTSVDLVEVNIDTLNLPKTVDSIDLMCLQYMGLNGIVNINVDENNTVFSSVDGVLYNKNKDILIRYPSGRENASFTVLDTVKVIDICAFKDSNNLSDITLPEKLETINASAFDGCKNLEKIALPNSVSTIENAAFAMCESINSITLPENLTILNNNVFASCQNLKKITLSTNLETISSYAFSNCSSLNSIMFGSKLETIEQRAFNGCSALETISIPEGVINIGHDAFSNCTKLKTVNIPASTTNIDVSIFSNCSNIESIIIDSKNPVYDSRNDCNAIIETATDSLLVGSNSSFIPDTIKTISYNAFAYCDNLKEITIPNSVTTIEDYAFINCINLNKITFTSNLQNIGDRAFCQTNLESVILPNTLSSINLGVFESCKNLKSIVFLSTNTIFEENTWDETNNTIVKNCHEDLIIYGYKTSTTKDYAQKHALKFIAIDDADNILIDTENNISVITTETVKLSVSKIGEEAQINNINIMLSNEEVDKLYDINLSKDGETIQPNLPVVVKIPTDNKNARVYRVEEDNTQTNMHATYSDGYMVFITEHFSKYVLTVPKVEETYTLGDVDGDGKVTILDATQIQRHLAQLTTITNDRLECADTDKDGKVTIIDATQIQRFLAKLIPEL